MIIATLLTLILFAILWPPMTRKLIGFAIGAVVVLFVVGSVLRPKEPTTIIAASAPPTTITWNPPPDPGAGQYVSKVDFTTQWAIGLRGFKTLQELQTATGAKGVITGRELYGPHPSATFMWSSQPPTTIDDDKVPPSMIASVLPNGVFAYIHTSEDRYIAVDSTGAVSCDACVPPVNIAGSR